MRHVFFLVALGALPGCFRSHERASGSPTDAGRPLDAPGPARCGRMGETWEEPGCVDSGEVHIAPGCYQACTGPDDRSCSFGLRCRSTSVDPCPCVGGTDCCGSCASDAFLCLPPDPPPGDCDTRDYCECRSGCVPLLDVGLGCVCPCEPPFYCGGPSCACDCRGAQYMGCARAGRCAETEVSCPPGCLAYLADGCPACAC